MPKPIEVTPPVSKPLWDSLKRLWGNAPMDYDPDVIDRMLNARTSKKAKDFETAELTHRWNEARKGNLKTPL